MNRPTSQQSRVLKLVKYDRARQLILESILKLPTEEEIETRSALNRVILQDIEVPRDKPEFDVAAIDGYALASVGTKTATSGHPVRYEVVGRSFPDQLIKEQWLRSNQALYVACGALIPHGADCVVKFEHVKEMDSGVEISHSMISSKNIITRGEDMKLGTRLLSSGHFCRPQDIGAILSIGQTRVRVAKQPVVGVLSVGSELTEVNSPKEGFVINDHAYSILGFLQGLGARSENLGVSDDNPDNIGSRLKDGLVKCDMIITMGGCSVGARDTVPGSVSRLDGSRLLFHGLRLSPGKVTGMFVVNEKPVVMLAGHITTAISGFFAVVAGILQRLMRVSPSEMGEHYDAKVLDVVETKPGMARFLLAKVKRVDEELVAVPFGFDTNLFSTLISANSYSIISENSSYKSGGKIRFYPLNQIRGYGNGSLNRSHGT